MLFGFTGVELSLIIVAISLFGGILSGFPVAYAISGSAVVSFALIAGLNELGLLYTLQEYNGVIEQVPVFERGWEKAMLSTESTWAQGVFSPRLWRQCGNLAGCTAVCAHGDCPGTVQYR